MQIGKPKRVRDHAREAIGEMIVAGAIRGGAHLDEVSVSKEIGVSRTPVREAMIALEADGLVESRPRRGFVAVEPRPDLVRECFPILGALEALAVELNGTALAARTGKMRKLNERLARETMRKRQYELDRAFHVLLTEGCGNSRLLALIDVERTRLRLIDGHHGKGIANREQSVAQHEAIITAIEDGRISDAADLLVQHWNDGIEVVVEWLEQKTSETQS